MDMNELLKRQLEMDELHGFPVNFSNDKDKYDQLTKDLVGLFGEIGEFSNIVKKINIKLEDSKNYELNIPASEECLQDELVDCFIYIMRLAAILRVDLESKTLMKINRNAVRYSHINRE